MHDLYLLPDDNIPEHWEEGKDRGEAGGAIDDQERNVVDFEAIGEVPHTRSPFICMRYNYYFVPPIDKLASQLVDMTLDASRLRKEPIADQGDIVGHVENDAD